jgi:peptidoglycan endopeptidase LytF
VTTPVAPPKPPVVPIPDSGLSDIDRMSIAREQYKITKIVKDTYNQYTFSCSNPSGGVITASFRDNVKSGYKVYDNGISYIGQAMPQLPISLYQSVGLTEAQAKALRYVSMHEGKYDAINTYDKAIFSFGFIQFTGSSITGGGSLGILLAFYKQNCPDLFKRYFSAVGIEVHFNIKNNLIDVSMPTTVSVINEMTGEKATGDDAWKYMKDHLPLIGPFIQSAYEPSMVREQLRVAAMMYVSTALNLKVNVPVFGKPFPIPAISQVLRSEGAMTMLIDLCVNRGAGGLAKVIVPAITAIAESVNVASLADLCNISDLDVANMLITQNLAEDRIVKRTQSIIDAGLSFAKGFV